MGPESDAKALRILGNALRSSNRSTRVRAVSMLAHVDCAERRSWLDRACHDDDPAVADVALIVAAWVESPEVAPWPEREDPALDAMRVQCEPDASLDASVSFRWEWEYAVEVWRDDGLLVGVFLSTTCQEDDEHARRIALGQAILASSGRRGDAFDPERAAAFIVAKRCVQRDARPPRDRRRGHR